MDERVGEPAGSNLPRGTGPTGRRELSSFTRRSGFWTLFALSSLALAGFSFWFFPRAFPVVSLDIAMTREAALRQARALAERHGWGPGGEVQAAASFERDEEVQTFVELEGGGPDAFRRLLAEGFYAPYGWRVRLFRQGEARETSVRFTPEGNPLGFVERVPEDEARPSLDAAAARRLAEREAATRWRTDLDAHALAEASQERRPGGRVDHTLVYERRGAALGEGRYRLRIVVTGDRVSEVMPLVRVPEAFSRRYEEMRSANTAVGAAGSIAGGVLYLVVGCGLGLFLLMRRRALVWRPALIAASVVALAQVLADLNAWPLAWLDYDTAVPTRAFVAQALVRLATAALAMAVVFGFSFMAAEGLSRLAFPHHPQLWRAWTRDAAPTPSIAGRTAGGYLLVPFDLAYVLAFYYVAGRVLGWWNPSEALLNPDSLAHYQPWFTPFARALQAGVWEECLFRAVPIAGAALLGDRLGHRRLLVGIALVVQAAIFGAVHAPYPAQPAYARPVELIVPSFVFGFLYLRYGLLPAIVLHFVFDVVLMALPIFAATGAGVWVDRVLVVVAALVPALVVVVARMRAGAWHELPAALRNAAWVPPKVPDERTPEAPPAHPARAWPRGIVPALAVASLVTLPLALWMAVRARPDVPRVAVDRAVAVNAAHAALEARGVALHPGTRALVTIVDAPVDEDRFVWQTAGRTTYEALLGSWLDPPRYRVRFARFEGDVADRADEWQVAVGPTGQVLGVRHLVPEARAGARLDEEAARAVARMALARDLGTAWSSVREVSAVPSKLPARTDWSFAFAAIGGAALPQGERRLRIDIAGDEVVGAARHVHVPEEWQRQQRAIDATLGILAALGAVATAMLLASGAIAAVVAWSRGRFAVRHFLVAGLAMVVTGLMGAVNGWPSTAARFSTAQPFRVQAMLAWAGLAVGVGAVASVVALVAGLVAPWRRAHAVGGTRNLALAGILLGTVASAASLVTASVREATAPTWPTLTGAAALVPALAPVLGGLAGYLLLTVAALLLFGTAERVTAGWTRRRVLALSILFVVGALVGGTTSGGTVRDWAASALVAGLTVVLAHVLVVRHDLAIIPLATAAVSVVELLPDLRRPYAGALLGGLGAATVVAVAGWAWFRALGGGVRMPGPGDGALQPDGGPSLVSVSIVGVLAVVAATLSAAMIWLMLTDPLAVFDAWSRWSPR